MNLRITRLFLEGASDLNTAIKLAVLDRKYQKVLCLALTQRAILNRLLGKVDGSISLILLFILHR